MPNIQGITKSYYSKINLPEIWLFSFSSEESYLKRIKDKLDYLKCIKVMKIKWIKYYIIQIKSSLHHYNSFFLMSFDSVHKKMIAKRKHFIENHSV